MECQFQIYKIITMLEISRMGGWEIMLFLNSVRLHKDLSFKDKFSPKVPKDLKFKEMLNIKVLRVLKDFRALRDHKDSKILNCHPRCKSRKDLNGILLHLPFKIIINLFIQHKNSNWAHVTKATNSMDKDMDMENSTIKTEVCMMEIGPSTECQARAPCITSRVSWPMKGTGKMINLWVLEHCTTKTLNLCPQASITQISMAWMNIGQNTLVLMHLFRSILIRCKKWQRNTLSFQWRKIRRKFCQRHNLRPWGFLHLKWNQNCWQLG